MKKCFILFFALLLFAGAVCAQQPDRTYITLVNDDPESVNIDAPTAYLVNYTVSDDIVVLFARTDSVRVAITTENNDSLFVKDFFYTVDAWVSMKYTGIPDGKYWLNVFYEGFWWKGDFEFVSHKPKGLDVYIDSTYYRLKNDGTAVTEKPDINGRTVSHRMFWNAFERDYPLHVVIPSELTYEGETYEVVGVEGGSFKYCHFLLSVSLPNTITSIGDCAFKECDNLLRVNIPESVTSIGGGVFMRCLKLNSIVFPEGIETLKEQMFVECKNLCSVTLPSSLTKIERLAFHSCSSLPFIDIPDGVTSIGEYAFYGCSNLLSVTLPEKITRIEDNAFIGMPNSAHIYCHAKEPCKISKNAFNYNCTLHVPHGCLDKYLSADNWCDFAYIVEMDEMDEEESGNPVYGGETGVAPALSDDAASDGQFYDLQGRPADGTKKGLYIRNGKKVLVK